MISIRKTKTLILIVLGTLFVFSPITITNFNFENSDFGDGVNSDHDNLKISKVSAPIWIDDTNPSMNWSVAKEAGLCTGSGNYTHPYVIEDLVIDEVPGITISNSDVYFWIENCTVYGTSYGIRLENVKNGQLIDNNCSSNYYSGIYLSDCINNTISANTLNNNSNWGIYLYNSQNNSLSGNIMNGCGLLISGSFEDLNSHDIDDTNLVNGKPLYYYVHEASLVPNNFTNAGQVLLVNCNDSLVSNLDISFTSNAVSMYYCHNNNISVNTLNNNIMSGITLSNSNNNTLFNNTASNNGRTGIGGTGISLGYSNNNNILGNIVNNNIYGGISLGESDNNTILGNTANYNEYGIFLSHYSSYNNVSGNTAYYNDRGIFLDWSSSNTILGNTLSYNNYGIVIFVAMMEGYYNNVSGNIMNKCGILTDAFQYIDTTNLVNGKPVYYYTDEVDLGPNNFTNAGQVIMLSCTNSVISNLNTSYSSIGIYLRSCYNCTITGNIANFNEIRGISITYGAYNNISGNSANYNGNDGIYLDTEYSDISGNIANYNGDNGIYLFLCNRNNISGNTANYNENGMYFDYGHYSDITENTANNNSGSGIGLGLSNNNTISGNTANNNTYGIYLTSSDYNTISGNTLIGNVECIREENCQGNKFSDNGSCTYGEGDGEQPIPGYNLFILFGILSIVAILITKKVKKS